MSTALVVHWYVVLLDVIQRGHLFGTASGAGARLTVHYTPYPDADLCPPFVAKVGMRIAAPAESPIVVPRVTSKSILLAPQSLKDLKTDDPMILNSAHLSSSPYSSSLPPS